ncbi:hypothetical protein KFL01_16880 [Kocuria flava]|uniref:CBS domain-containing protein n=1 Tax=Kocuria flava TaxID=446860 RepID=A0ABQ0X4M7_9MICC|nr:hypothetical protein KFL01_16880 [Kocuria flava]
MARALAADPPVLLMDEPFGAVDPITRQRLQDELINIQHELQKTIVCVTHDFDEAVKLGDWIAVFDEGARVVQYDAPERILAEPADEFVEDFIGSGAGLKQLTLTRVREVDLVPAATARPGEDVRAVLRRADETGTRDVVVVDDRGRPLSWPSRRQLERVGTVPRERNERLPLVGTNSTLNDALDTMLVSSTGAALVVGARDRFEGVIYVETVMAAITEARRSVAAEDAPLGHNTGELPAVDATPGGGGR